MSLTVARLRSDAIRRTFFAPATLRAAIQKLGFVQADPIRSPARAQDLILRHRVKNYRAGDLERRYRTLDIEEDFFYAYGFLPRANWNLLHPRVMSGLNALDRRVLDVVTGNGPIHPRELEAELGRERAVNPWGGYSKATTRSLQHLHYRGLLRIARRESGIRIFEANSVPNQALSPEERLRRLVMLMARILAPLPAASLRQSLALLRYGLQGPELRRSLVDELVKSGELESGASESVLYVWPAGKIVANEAPRVVRILAPFDPLVWDRRRFEHFFGWAYRFEAYTPEPRRVRGYYAMPILWEDRMVGWVNTRASKFEIGYQTAEPRDRAFRVALDEELERFRWFLASGRE